MSEWLSLGEAVQYAADRGIGVDEAKITICTRIAQRRIKIDALSITAHQRGKLPAVYDLDIPGHLEPTDFDWDNSYTIGPRIWRFRDILGQPCESFHLRIRVLAAGINALFGPRATTVPERVTSTRADKPTAKRGPKKYDWDDVEQFLFRTMDEKGDFEEPNQTPDWNRQACAEEVVRQYMIRREDEVPAESIVRTHVVEIAASWRKKQKAEI
jgi:hypothetical protein